VPISDIKDLTGLRDDEIAELSVILGLERIDCFQADIIQGLSCIAKYRFPIKLGMTGDEKEIGFKARIAAEL